MQSFSDLVSLLNEAILLSLKTGISHLSSWLGGGLVAAVLAFYACGAFCRLWNRHYRFTPLHLVSFLIASAISAYCVLLWPGSSNLDQAMSNRVERWRTHLADGKVEVDDSLRRIAQSMDGMDKKIEGQAQIPWSVRLFLESRKALIDAGFKQTESSNRVDEPGALNVSLAFAYSKCVEEFRSMNPFLGSRLPVDDNASLQAYTQSYLAEQSKSVVGAVHYGWMSGEIGGIIKERLEPQISELAHWTRIVSVSCGILAIALPGVISGLVSYLQIRTGVAGTRKSGRSSPAAPKSTRRRTRVS